MIIHTGENKNGCRPARLTVRRQSFDTPPARARSPKPLSPWPGESEAAASARIPLEEAFCETASPVYYELKKDDEC